MSDITNIIVHDFSPPQITFQPNKIRETQTKYFHEVFPFSNVQNKIKYNISNVLMELALFSKYECRREGANGKMMSLFDEPTRIRTVPDNREGVLYGYIELLNRNESVLINSYELGIKIESVPTQIEIEKWESWYK